MTRQDAERLITQVLYGLADTEKGREVLLETIEEMGTSAFTDEAIIAIAKRQDSLARAGAVGGSVWTDFNDAS